MASSVTFWFEFASTYSYLSVMRLDAEADARGVETIWKPFLLGPIFQSQGWNTSPFSIYPEKGENMWRDMERRAEKYGLDFKRPDQADAEAFPQHSVLAARVAIACLAEPWGRDFCRKVFRAQFAQGLKISDPAVIGDCLERVGAHAQTFLKSAQSDASKSALRLQTDEARSRGIYGAPSFIVDGELFWGDDRLDDALDWAERDQGENL